MFEPITNLKSREYYKDEILGFYFNEFCDLKYVLDPRHESEVIFKCLYNLSNYCLCICGKYSSSTFKNYYSVLPFDIEPEQKFTYINYRDRIITLFDTFLRCGEGVFELIRLIICYAKTKGYDVKNIWENGKKTS